MTAANNDLFQLLNIDHICKQDMKRFNGDAIIEEVQRNPNSAAMKYEFPRSYSRGGNATSNFYPLHQAMRLGASIDVVEAIYNSYTPAIQTKCGSELTTALHLAFHHRAPTDVVLFLLNKWPQAAREKDHWGVLPLHCACYHNAPVEVLSCLFDSWPDAAAEKNNYGYTPLHNAIIRSRNISVKNVSLLLDVYPYALREKTDDGMTPLHRACLTDAPLEVILLMLEKWQKMMTKERDIHDTTLLDIYKKGENSETVDKVLYYVYQLCICGEKMDNGTLRQIMNYFVDIEWWNGVVLILEQYPRLAKVMEMEVNFFPIFLSMVGQRCRLKTMWHVVSNELDIIEGI